MDESISEEGRLARHPRNQELRIAPDRESCIPRALGGILAGGGSRRFGSPKALAPFLGTPMVLRAVAALEGVCETVTVVTHLAEVEALLPGRTLRDAFPGLGPLAGLHAALREADRQGCAGVFLLACDMPLVAPGLIRRILERATGGPDGTHIPEAAVVPQIAAVPEGSQEVEPLCAWYPVGLLGVAARRLRGGTEGPGGPRALSMHAFLEEVPTSRILLRDLDLPTDPDPGDPDIGDLDPFRSANTPEALAALETTAAAHPALFPHLTRHRP